MEEMPQVQEEALTEAEKESITALTGPLKKIVETLRPEIERGEYTLIIGDDVSGRIPTLILKEVIDTIYTERGFPKPPVRFIAGSRTAFMSEIAGKRASVALYVKDLVSKLTKSPGNKKGKVLLVTEYVSTGEGLKLILEALKEQDAEVDIASTHTDYSTTKSVLGTRLISGGGLGLPFIYGNRTLSGVAKRPAELHAHLLKNTDHYVGQPSKIQPRTSAVRSVAHEVAQALIASYKENT